jgi:hypothetical protein
MHYLIQQNLFKEQTFDLILDTLKRYGLTYEVCRFLPFVHEIEFTTTRKDVWCFGAIKMAHIANKYGFVPGSMYNSNHDYEVYSKYYRDNLLNWGGVVMCFTDTLPGTDEYDMFFARPTEDTKVFFGQVFMRHSWGEYVAHCISNDTATIIEKETKVLVAPLQTIYQEIRCWVVDGKVITISQYKLGTRVVSINLDNDVEAFSFAQSMVDIYQPARAFCIDICRTPNGFKIVEINCINCSGFYAMDFSKLLQALENTFGKY